MIDSIDALAAELGGTPLEGRAIRKVRSINTKDPAKDAFAIELDATLTDDEWRALRALVRPLGLYPVLTDVNHQDMRFTEEPSGLDDDMDQEDMVFDEEQPDATEPIDDWIGNRIAESRKVDAAQYLAGGCSLPTSSVRQSTDTLDWLCTKVAPDYRIDKTFERFGDAPSIQQIRDLKAAGVLRTDADLERWLLGWELERFDAAALAPGPLWHIRGREDYDGYPVVVLLPTTESWQALLYMGWFGFFDHAAETAAVLRHWSERHGAELCAAFGTTLHLVVGRRPGNLDEAFALAVEHGDFARDTLLLPGITLRDHARALLTVDHWFFHSKP